MKMNSISMDVNRLLEGYRSQTFSVSDVLDQVLARINNDSSNPVWISRILEKDLKTRVSQLENLNPSELPLYGIPFAVKDNIDTLLLPTTAGCPDFSYQSEADALVVKKLLDAGAILIGKTNMDQFATGLVGTRSPYGVCRNAHNPEYISGGSSSGSAVATALGHVSFALGTDTAGSGRVPAALNNVVGLKPTIGRISTSGIVPACRSLDCVSIFALNCADAQTVFNIASESEGTSPVPEKFLRPTHPIIKNTKNSFLFAVPHQNQLSFFGNSSFPHLFQSALDIMTSLGGQKIECDFTPFQDVAQLLYDGPWVAERYSALGEFIEKSPNSLMPTTKTVIESGKQYSASDLFLAQNQLRVLQRQCANLWNHADVLITPTIGTAYRIGEISANPVSLNSNLGYYTNFVNLLDLCAIALPAGFSENNIPFGITLTSPAYSESRLLSLGSRFHSQIGIPSGTKEESPPQCAPLHLELLDDFVNIAVCGAHMSGLPLNYQLTDVGGRYLDTRKTSDNYRLFALPGGPPYRPGLVKNKPGAGIELEIWRLSKAAFGHFVSQIPSPLGIGQVELENGDQVCGFLCEAHALADARDITEFTSWRKFLADIKDL